MIGTAVAEGGFQGKTWFVSLDSHGKGDFVTGQHAHLVTCNMALHLEKERDAL